MNVSFDDVMADIDYVLITATVRIARGPDDPGMRGYLSLESRDQLLRSIATVIRGRERV